MRLVLSSTLLVLFIIMSGIAISITNSLLLRALLICLMLFVYPGLSIVLLLDVKGWLTKCTLVATLSIVMSTIVASVMLYANIWSPFVGLYVLMGLSMVVAVAGPVVQLRNLALAQRI